MHFRELRWKFIKRFFWRFSRSLQWKLVSIFISITLALMIIMWLFLIDSIESTYFQSFKTSIESGLNKWEYKNNPSAGKEQVTEDLVNRNSAILIFYAGEDRTYAIVDSDNLEPEDIVFYDSRYKDNNRRSAYLEDLLKSKNFVTALSGETGDKEILMHTGDGTAFYDYAWTNGNYILYFRYYRQDLGNTIDNLNIDLLKSSIIAIILSLLIGYLLSKTITIPIIKVMHKAQKVAGGDFDQLVDVKSDDEIGKLTKTFNFMAKELKQKIIGISSEKSKIETILKYMADGVIAFNMSGEVIHSNPASLRMLGIKDASFTFYEFAKSYSLDISIEGLLEAESSTTRETNIRTMNKIIKIYFALFTDEENKAEGIIIVLQDITEQQRLEEMRKEFVANVSHELRTPLTSIKSYAETLLDGEYKNGEIAEKFLGVINSEADRMTRLVKDLLQLSSLDNQKVHWNMKNIKLIEIVKNCVNKMSIDAKNKEQSLEFFVEEDPGELYADRDRIEQVVINIISNAIKYTPAKGIITVSVGVNENMAFIKVADTGIGISQEDLKRVFERFYRVDKARSREMGGTGLGLAIAKEIVEAHGGTISISSELGAGTVVVVNLKMLYEVRHE
ncbi:ATP-binding protein [Pseudobacteroides cellulosolvens]|uniref:histidine kinase n=2 Tax=Pseudobacteroides cellulosolvens TaxID=35825 RepID=A0A0L6JUV0_9FIRM|nr:ATP-binding protein [Pseudobacteroides cellulosolvens]KNY29636.1 integral membrane sensor signal transduction histidine kinase [Pseudobacteroides cellulosolvens ATCC 35603 = DSM 2933]